MNSWLSKLMMAVAIVAVGWVSLWSQTTQVTPITSGEQLQVLSTTLPNGLQQLVVVDSRARSMAVYQVDAAQGKIQLKSVRSLVWDLAMEQFNGQPPLPSELRQVRP
jgi:hypothetical protein